VFRQYPQHFIDSSVLAQALIDTFDVPKQGAPEVLELLGNATVVRLRKGRKTVAELHPNSLEQAELLASVIGHGIRGLVPVPHSSELCKQVRQGFLEWVAKRDEALKQVIERHTGDEELQEKLTELIAPVTWSDGVQPTFAPPLPA
jgi:hypothetical protein